APPDRRMRTLVDARAQRGEARLEELALVDEGLLGPGAHQHLERLRAPLAAVVAAQAVAHELVLVVEGAAAHAHVESAPAQVVEESQLDGQPHRVPQGELDHREADPHAGGAGGERARERDGVAVDGLPGEVVLGEPDRVEAQGLRGAGLLELLGDRDVIALGRRGVRQREPAEAHRGAAQAPMRVRASSISPRWVMPWVRPTCPRHCTTVMSPSGFTVMTFSRSAGEALAISSSVPAHTRVMYSRKSGTSLIRRACASSVDMPVPCAAGGRPSLSP